MKHFGGVSHAMLLSAILACPAVAGIEEELAQPSTREAAVVRLVSQLTSNDKCSQQEAAFALGEARVREAVIPLMGMLHDGEESCRIAAALALSRLGDPRGTFAVKRAARFDESARVRTLAAWFYEQYVEAGTYKFIADDGAGTKGEALGAK
jgi:HEAT repeat protein